MHNTPPTVALNAPIMTKELFAELSGLRSHQIKGQIERKNLPIYKVGRLTLINVAAITTDRNMGAVVCPVATKDRFSEVTGLTPGQVEAQLDINSLPQRRVGRLVMVDVAELHRLCLLKKPEIVSD